MDPKKNIFFIVLGVVVVGAIIAYMMTVPTVAEEVTSKQSQIETRETEIATMATKAAVDDNLKNSQHVAYAVEYGKTLNTQIDALQKSLQGMTLQTRFESVPTDSIPFDKWLGEKRAAILDQATAAGLRISQDKEKPEVRAMLLLDPTNETSDNPTFHRAYRLRHVALLEEVVSILSKKYGRIPVLKFESDATRDENRESVDAGPLLLENFVVVPSKLTSERQKMAYEEAVRRSGRSGTVKNQPASDLPVSTIALDLQFVTPFSTIPAIVQALESSTRYTGIVTRIDTQRTSAPYPAAEAAKVGVAGAVPLANTHYQEAPVRVLVSLDILEYDKTKEPKPAPPATKKK